MGAQLCKTETILRVMGNSGGVANNSCYLLDREPGTNNNPLFIGFTHHPIARRELMYLDLSRGIRIIPYCLNEHALGSDKRRMREVGAQNIERPRLVSEESPHHDIPFLKGALCEYGTRRAQCPHERPYLRMRQGKERRSYKKENKKTSNT